MFVGLGIVLVPAAVQAVLAITPAQAAAMIVAADDALDDADDAQLAAEGERNAAHQVPQQSGCIECWWGMQHYDSGMTLLEQAQAIEMIARNQLTLAALADPDLNPTACYNYAYAAWAGALVAKEKREEAEEKFELAAEQFARPRPRF